MSDGELTRLDVLRDLDQRRLTTEGAVADNKRLGPVLAMIRNERLRCRSERRSGSRRRDQRRSRLFKMG
jgi:hypothetical protein